jgi:hypothetical protein
MTCENKVSYILEQAARVSRGLSTCKLSNWVVETATTFASAMTISPER